MGNELQAQLLEANVWIPPLGHRTVQQIVLGTRRRRIVVGRDLKVVLHIVIILLLGIIVQICIVATGGVGGVGGLATP